MTPKEKAIELIMKFKAYTLSYRDEFSAKQCVLICVDEILQDGVLEKAPFMRNGKDLMNGNFIRYKDYWIEVKQEIEKL